MRLDGQGDLRDESEGLLDQEHPGGGRFNRLILITFAVVAIVSGVVVALGVESSRFGTSGVQKQVDDPGASARNSGEIADLAAHGGKPLAAPAFVPPPVVVATAQAPIQNAPPRPPTRYAQWAEEKYMKALEAPQMVSVFHGGGTLEIAHANGQQSTNFNTGNSTDPTVTLHPPASAFSVMAGSVIPAVLVSGINSDLPGPILAQVSENVFDSATGKYLLVPQGSRLIGIYQNASAYGQQRVEIAWQRLIFPNTSSMNLPQMPGADQGGYAGFTDEVNNHYMRTFGTAALMSLISAGQMVGQMATFGAGATYGPYGYSQPNQWAMASQTAGSAASGQFGAVGQQMIGQGMNRPPTIEIRPGYQFNVMVTEDLVFPAAYKG
ncbi:MAG TPA: TrbI/VirB10 family protein [Candidatus Binataceae bacterium]|nr:TrbI/VirB10 family protein [Candidatus Binataceae bacterium]